MVGRCEDVMMASEQQAALRWTTQDVAHLALSFYYHLGSYQASELRFALDCSILPAGKTG
jgi:hypothetical protein